MFYFSLFLTFVQSEKSILFPASVRSWGIIVKNVFNRFEDAAGPLTSAFQGFKSWKNHLLATGRTAGCV